MLYQNIRRPIKALIRGVQQLKKGNYAARIPVKGDNEFTFLFHKFNDMAQEIDLLVGKVYAEQLRSREATLKQLQSQINPHFLYNCLAFMKSMAVLEEKEAIIAMSVSLSKYYRYTTRNEQQLVSVREEMALVENYLRIQGLQMKRLSVSIELPDALLDKQIPRLLIQPVVENAIVHGIEPCETAGRIVIRGELGGRGEHDCRRGRRNWADGGSAKRAVPQDQPAAHGRDRLRLVERASAARLPVRRPVGLAVRSLRGRRADDHSALA
ncbi:sensor histidine kinase [Cohnella rhizosphaerae]|uniref:Histidine kinase n=1 Tax=Cohnella rhizosphaerae TaxID=1457232 RepID=A0A9X4QTP5_9BACL|nr:histidine kinase [Cohnella rhizosphaerae]MDG0810644.1 histidine kinase [Cohnella rhizosphaerae]